MNKKIAKMAVALVLPILMLTAGKADAIQLGGIGQWQAMQNVHPLPVAVPPAGFYAYPLTVTGVVACLVVASVVAACPMVAAGYFGYLSEKSPTDASNEVNAGEMDADEKAVK